MKPSRFANTTDYAIAYESATLLDLCLEVSSIHIGIKNPQGLINALQLRTSLSLLDGCGHGELSALSQEMEATCYCGHKPPVPLDITIEYGATSPLLEIGVGPYSMYMSDIHLRTRTSETFSELFERVLNRNGRDHYLVALAPISRRQAPDMGAHLKHLGRAMDTTDGHDSQDDHPHDSH